MKEHKPAPELTVMKQAASFDKPPQLCSTPGASCSLRAEELLSPHRWRPVLFQHMNINRCDRAQSSISVQHCCQRREQVEERQHFPGPCSSALVIGTWAQRVTCWGTQAPLCLVEALTILTTCCHKAGTYCQHLGSNHPIFRLNSMFSYFLFPSKQVSKDF